MSAETPFDKPGFKQRITDAVKSGDRIRQRVAAEVSAALRDAQVDAEGLSGLVRSVVDAARAGLDQSMERDQVGAFRAVAEGLGDGITTTADALRLTLQEAKGRGQRFAREDLDRIVSDLQSLGGMFVSTLADTARRLGAAAGTETRALVDHAERTYQRIRPSVEAALTAAVEHPIALGKDTLHAGLTVGTRTAGTLLSEVGKRLQRMGQRLQGGRES